jgi:hypothetical protein
MVSKIMGPKSMPSLRVRSGIWFNLGVIYITTPCFNTFTSVIPLCTFCARLVQYQIPYLLGNDVDKVKSETRAISYWHCDIMKRVTI